MGFPLAGFLAAQANVTTGDVSSGCDAPGFIAGFR
jgi:hypothetical protein